MRVAPVDLDPADVAAVLAVGWGLRDVGLTYTPVGFGAHHWVADVAGRAVWFVTATPAGEAVEPAFRTARALADLGVAGVVAPVTTELGDVVEPYRRHLLSVTPWLPDAVEHPGEGPEVVELLASLHRATDAVRWLARRDDLTVEARPALERALAELDRPWGDAPYAADVRALLAAAADRVRAGLAAHDTRAARVDPASFVVTHGEPKPGNLLATPSGIALVDWDTALLAPAERDLWRLPDVDRAAYTARTGRDLDPDVLALYRDRWDLTDVALYVAELREAPTRTDDAETAWAVLRGLLRP